jgi:hypothetical protein
METKMAKAARVLKAPGIRAMPAPHIEKAERKQSHLGVCMAVDQVSKLRNFGHPWRMKQSPRKTRSNKRAQAEYPPGVRGKSRVIRSVIGLEGQQQVDSEIVC